MRLKTRLLGAASALAIAGSMMAFAAPAAHAVVVPAGSCTGALNLGTLVPGLGDQTAPVAVTSVATTNKVTLLKNGGSCDGTILSPQQAATGTGPVPASLPMKATTTKVAGAASCATGATAIAADATAASAYPLNGKGVFTSYTLNALLKPWQIQVYVDILGFNALFPDVINADGVVIKGPSVGGNVSGGFWFNPAIAGSPGVMNSGYVLDPNTLTTLAGCADGTPNNVPLITKVLVGGGGATTNSLLFGSPAPGLLFQFGQP